MTLPTQKVLEFKLSNAWRIIMHDMRISADNVLRRAGLPVGLFCLTKTTISLAEISFLLGSDDPTSFFRTFHRWIGTTPERVRLAAHNATEA